MLLKEGSELERGATRRILSGLLHRPVFPKVMQSGLWKGKMSAAIEGEGADKWRVSALYKKK